MEDKKWYILQVRKYKENTVKEKLMEKGIEAIVPMENRVIRQGGKWVQKLYVLFEGYVFLHIQYNRTAYYQISKISGVVRMLGNYNEENDIFSDEMCCDKPEKKKSLIFEPIPLTMQEEKMLICQQNIFLNPPVINLFDDGSYEIISEEFKRIEVVKIDRHARRITFLTTIAGENTLFTLSFIKADKTSEQKAE